MDIFVAETFMQFLLNRMASAHGENIGMNKTYEVQGKLVSRGPHTLPNHVRLKIEAEHGDVYLIIPEHYVRNISTHKEVKLTLEIAGLS